MADKYVTKAELERALKHLHDDLKDNHFKAVLEALNHLFHELKEKLTVMQASLDTLGGIVAKLVADFGGTSTMIQGLRDQIAALVAQGSANAAELAALQAQIDAATPRIDAANAALQALDNSIADSTKPLDGSTPV